jgi:hypothetical protein
MSQKWQEYTIEDDTKTRFIRMPKGIRLWYIKKVKYALVDYDLYPTKYQLTEKGRNEVWQLYYEVAYKKSYIYMSHLTAHIRIPIEHFEHVITKLMEILPNNLEEEPELKKFKEEFGLGET